MRITWKTANIEHVVNVPPLCTLEIDGVAYVPPAPPKPQRWTCEVVFGLDDDGVPWALADRQELSSFYALRKQATATLDFGPGWVAFGDERAKELRASLRAIADWAIHSNGINSVVAAADLREAADRLAGPDNERAKETPCK